MASRKRKRLSAWELLARLGHTGDDRDEIVQHVFDAVSRVTLRGEDGEPLDGDDYLVGVFESLGTTKDWPGFGTPEWERLRYQALMQVVRRLGREGLYDCISVGVEGAPAVNGRPTDGTGARDKNAECEINSKPPAAKDESSESDGVDARDGEDKPDVAAGRRPTKTSNTMLRVSGPAAKDEGSVADAVEGDEAPTGKDDNPDARVGVQVGRALIRRCQRNPKGWFRCVDRVTPYRVLVQWASETCPGASAESLAELMDALREVRWWDDDGHIIGGEMLRTLEAELEAGCNHKKWMLVVSDFEAAIGRLRGVFEKLSLL